MPCNFLLQGTNKFNSVIAPCLVGLEDQRKVNSNK